MRAAPVLLAALALLATACTARGQRSQTILQARGDSVHVRLLDAGSARPLADAAVEIWSDNGVRCIRAPCPTNGQRWQGRTDAAGIVAIPTGALQASTTITTPGYEGGDLVRDARQGRDGWKMRLRRTPKEP